MRFERRTREIKAELVLEEQELYRILGAGVSIDETSYHDEKLEALAAMEAWIETANPTSSPRWEQRRISPTEPRNKFFCSVYGSDTVNVLPQGAMIPKKKGDSNLGANELNVYLNSDWSERHGWVQIMGTEDQIRTRAQELANEGKIVVASGGGRPEVSAVAHFTVIAPESVAGRFGRRQARRRKGSVLENVAAQAGLEESFGVVPLGRVDIFEKEEDGEPHHSNPGIWFYNPAWDQRSGQ